jgi:flagellar biogenesis protein FliO
VEPATWRSCSPGLLVVIAAIVVLAFLMRRMTGVQSRLGERVSVW